MTQVLGSGHPNWDELIHPQTPEQKERVRILTERYKLDPVWMKHTDEKYGPLEWRLPETHAIYWASLGLEVTKDQKLRKEQFVGLRRVIFQSLQLAFMRGRLIYPDKTGNEFVYGPNLDIIKQTSDAYIEQAKLEPEQGENILHAHRNFLGMAVYHLYTHNRKAAANEWYSYMKQLYPKAPGVEKNLEDYALSRIAEDVGETDPNRVKTIIMGAFETAFMNYALGDSESDTVAVNNEIFARRLWQRYMNEISGYKNNERRVGLPPLPLIREEVLKTVLSPDYGLDPLLAAQLRTRLELPPDYGIDTNAPPAAAMAPGTQVSPGTNSPPAAAQ
jgi:hypothetical protein